MSQLPSNKAVEVRYVVGDQLRVNRYRENVEGAQTLVSVTTVEPDETIVVRYYDDAGAVLKTVHYDRFGRHEASR